MAVPVNAQGQSAAPEFAVKSILQEHLARKFADRCKNIDFDSVGHDRHVRKRLADYSNRGVSGRDIFKRYAPIQPHRYQHYVAQFSGRHGLDGQSTLQDFCDAARREMQVRSPIGRMLKAAKGSGK